MMDAQKYRWKEFSCLSEHNSCVIEFQAFRGNNDEYIVKELVILDLKSGVTNYFLFKAPFPFHNLNEKNSRTNKWLSKFFHHLSWHEGFVEYSELENILIKYCSKYKFIFTSGLEKCEFLSLYVPSRTTVYNIMRKKEQNFPGICIGVRCNKHRFSNCAISNAYGLKATLESEIK